MNAIGNMIVGNWKTTAAGIGLTLFLFFANHSTGDLHMWLTNLTPVVLGLLAKDGDKVSSASH